MTTEIEKVPTKLERATKIKDELMKDGVHYGKVVDKQSDFLYLSGASLLADVFEIDGIMAEVREENIDGQSQITVLMDMVDFDGNKICVGVGTWDSGEMLGNMKGARQRGIAMAYKRAYVMGVRYATSSHGMFSQDKDVVDSRDVVQGTTVPRQQTSEPTQAVDTDTGEKVSVPLEMRFDENRKETRLPHLKSYEQGQNRPDFDENSSPGRSFRAQVYGNGLEAPGSQKLQFWDNFFCSIFS